MSSARTTTLFLRVLKKPGILARSDQQFQLARRMQRLLARPRPQAAQAQHEIAQAIQHGRSPGCSSQRNRPSGRTTQSAVPSLR